MAPIKRKRKDKKEKKQGFRLPFDDPQARLGGIKLPACHQVVGLILPRHLKKKKKINK
jgi:hypothetical protein